MKLSFDKGFGLLSEIIRISNSTLDIDTRLKNILYIFSSAMEFKDVALYVLDAESDELYLKCHKNGIFREEFSLKGTPAAALFLEGKSCLLGGSKEERAFLTRISGDDQAKKGGIFPIRDDKFYFGALIIITGEGMDLDEEDLKLITPICQEIAGTMRNAQLYSRTREMVEDLLMINDVWKTMSSTIKLDELLHLIIQKISTALKASYGLVRLKDEEGRKAPVFFCNTNDSLEKETLLRACDLVCGHVCSRFAATIIDDLPQRLDLIPEQSRHLFKTVMAAPVMYREKQIGCIILFGKEEGASFLKKDLQLFATMASQMSAVTNNALLLEHMELINREKEVMVRELSNLFELNKAVMTTIELDRLLHIILTAVTIGDGFGFNRAMLFLYNEKSGFIQGMMGVGPDSPEEAWRIWAEINEKRKTLQDILKDEQEILPSSKLNEMVKSIRVSVRDKSILGLTVLEKQPYNIKDAKTDARVHMDILERINCRAFATAPLMASGRVVGVILVDNIYNERPITDDDIRLLTIFANQAGVAIDNSILYRNMQNAHKELKEAQGKLLHTEKLAALGEMSAGVAHEIRNPLVSIGGFARRLSRKLEEQEEKKYIDIICKEVERLEAILNEILIFSREEPAERETHNINVVIDDTLQFFWNDFKKNGIDVLKELEEHMGMVEANYHQLKQVFINLFSNARHAMSHGGRLKIRSYETDYEGTDFIMVEISDTGGGIPYSVMTNIFNPFFTTKNEGTGLGLAITHKILSTYKGDVEVMNNEEGGATFVIKIPVIKKKQD
ncbi:MAG: GAF domain-containing protein [Deltaproteobacteria bacterium]|nr:GAF domain-containing protein [Deltaproteobacteria bacterium]